MVKSGGELPEGEATASIHTMQPLCSPEWKFRSMARPKTKRVGTPHPEKARQALKRAGLESGSEVSRAKKKMAFEMVDGLIGKLHGEGRGSPDFKQVLIGEMLSTLAQMANDGNAPKREMVGLDDELVAGTSPAPDGRNLGEARKELEMVNHPHESSTTSHVNPMLVVGVACEGVDACDSQKEDSPKFTLHGQEYVGPFLENANLNSNATTCATHPPSPHLGLDECKGDRVPGAQPPEPSPEKLASPAKAWKAA